MYCACAVAASAAQALAQALAQGHAQTHAGPKDKAKREGHCSIQREGRQHSLTRMAVAAGYAKTLAMVYAKGCALACAKDGAVGHASDSGTYQREGPTSTGGSASGVGHSMTSATPMPLEAPRRGRSGPEGAGAGVGRWGVGAEAQKGQNGPNSAQGWQP